jgi:hypothetical protein
LPGIRGIIVNPEFSVIIAVNNDIIEKDFFRCLSTFIPQEGDVSFEFLVVDEADERRQRIYESQFPWVMLITMDKMRRGSYPRNLALGQVRGDYIVFLEDHVTVQRNHLLQLKEIFEKGYDAIGGSVINGSPESTGAWLQYFCEYHRWFPCRPSGYIGDLPGCNFAYRASTLKRLGIFVEGRYKMESLFNARAKAQGVQLYFAAEAPAIHFAFDARTALEYWRYRFHYGRDFAAHRGLGRGKRIFYAVFSPCLVGLAFFRIWSDVRRDRSLKKRFWKMTPVLLLTLAIWSIGEMCGYLIGSQDPNRSFH